MPPRPLPLVLALWLAGMALLPPGAEAQRSGTARVAVTLLDAETEQPTPMRVRLTDARGRVMPLPPEAVAVMYGLWDHADGYGYQPDSAFYVDGAFTLTAPPGTYHLALSRGAEYLAERFTLNVAPGDTARTFRLRRWIDLPARGWHSADGHVHLRRSPREDPLLIVWTKAEDVHVANLLRMGDFWETYYPQYAWGEAGTYREGRYLLTPGQEDPRTPELGHALGLGASDRVRYREQYYLYDKVFDRLHELGGRTGYAHHAETFHGYRGLTLDGLRGKVDVLELLQFCVSDEDPLRTEHYYHLLDLGYAVTAVAGSDFPWCGNDHDQGPPERRAQIGNARFYTYTGDTLTYAGWKAGLAAGHTFVTSGPILELQVNGRIPGDTLDAAPGTPLRITARALGHETQVPLSALEIVGHGEVLGRVEPGQGAQSPAQLAAALELPADRGLWLAARAYGAKGQAAHTTPVYVTVNGGGFHNPDTAPDYLALSERYLDELEHELDHQVEHLADPKAPADRQAWRYRDELQARITEVRALIQELKAKLK